MGVRQGGSRLLSRTGDREGAGEASPKGEYLVGAKAASGEVTVIKVRGPAGPELLSGREGKARMYLVNVDLDKCEGCGKCVECCPALILALKDGKVEVEGNPDDCLGCLSCEAVCECQAIGVQEL